VYMEYAPPASKRTLTFSASEINRLFGPEAAEDEDAGRLREYYFKGTTYADVTAELPLRILVGHKGIGKSALFKIAMLEDADRGLLPILIKPDDIAGLAKDSSDFLLTTFRLKISVANRLSQKCMWHYMATVAETST
jgi:hypothetical protein